MRHLTLSPSRVLASFSKRDDRLPHGSPHSNCAGFTIFEVALAAFVMAIGIATAIIAMQMGFKSLNDARDTTLAAQIMQSEIERLRLMAWDRTSDAIAENSIIELPSSATVSLSTMFTSNTALAAKFTVTRTVTADGTRPSEVKNIALSVTWKSYDGRSHTRTFDTIYCKNGLYDYYYTIAGP